MELKFYALTSLVTEQAMTHKFQEGDTVISKEETPDFLPAGSHGTVFCLYTTTPPAYEINFPASDGEVFGAIRYEDELERCLDPNCAKMPARN